MIDVSAAAGSVDRTAVGDVCHVAASAPPEQRTLCRRVVAEPSCCHAGVPACGRPVCPDCAAIAAEFGIDVEGIL